MIGVSDAFGYLSLLCWLGAQFPQVLVNIRNKSVEGLALPFLANWLFGDITNLVGCILTQQLPFQTYLASYFVFVDMTLVAQYIYYYKPAPASTASTPCQSRDLSPSPTGTPTIILSPTTYSPRNLTRPSSRTPLLTAGEIEAGFGSAKEYKKYRSTSHTSVRSHHRPHTSSSSRFAGVSAAYPPAGLLPTADEISASGSGTVRARSTSKHRQSDKDGFLGLRRQAEGSESRSRTRNDSEGRRNKNGEKQHFHLTDGEGDDEMSGLTDSFYSEASHASRASHPNAGVRRVSWSQAPPLIAPLTTTDQQGDTEATSPSGEGEDGDVTPMMAGNTPTPHGILQAAIGARQSRITTLSPRLAMSETSVPFAAASVGSTSASAEDLRQRSRSRGRTMSRPSPIAITPANVFINVTGDGLSPSTAGPTTEPTGSAPATGTIRVGSRSRLPAEQALLMEEMDQSIRRNLSGRARASTSGSSRRSASIVFLSLGLGGLLGFGRGGLPTTAGSVKPWSRSLDTLHALSGFDAEAAPRPYPVGRVLPETPHDSNQLLDISFPTVDDTAPRIHMENSHQEDENAPRPHGKDGKDGLRDRHPHDPPPLTPEQKRRLIGRISAWACTTLYLTSRLPQIWKNYTRKSVQGLSLALFVFAFLGNSFYVASILSSPIIWEYPPEAEPQNMFDLSTSTTALRTPFSSPAVVSADNILIADDILSPSLQPPITQHQSLPRPTFTIYSEETIPPYKTPRAQAFLRESLPYLLGSGGTLCFDVVIVTQGIIYGRREQLEDEEDDDDDDEEDEDEGDEGEGEEDEDDDEAGNRDAPERSPSRNRSSSVADSIVSRRAS